MVFQPTELKYSIATRGPANKKTGQLFKTLESSRNFTSNQYLK